MLFEVSHHLDDSTSLAQNVKPGMDSLMLKWKFILY